MTKVFCLLFIVLCPFFSYSQTGGEILSIHPVEFPEYDSIPDASDYYSQEVYDRLRRDTNVLYEKVVYESMDLKVVAYVARSGKVSTSKKYPVIIFNRGGYIRNNMSVDYLPLFHKLVEHGFMVVAPALRESEGGEGKDEVGGKDLADIWNLLPYIKSRGYVDLRNLFLLGESRGGTMTLLMLKAGFPVQAAAVYGATTDFVAYMEGDEHTENIARHIWPDYEENKASILGKRSAVQWAEQIYTPLLIMAGSQDQTINPQQSIDLATQMNKYGKDYELIIVRGGNHSLSGKDLERRDNEIIRWFKGALR
jgi:dipeptidyl aminopeptidase/acylaminoacyl peptidase